MIVRNHSAVVITGASSGVGRALALAVGSKAESVLLIGRDSDRLEAVGQEVAGAGGNPKVLQLDLGRRGDVTRVADELARTVASVSLLVHSAGVFVAGSFDALDAAAFETSWEVNVNAPTLLTRALLPALVKGEGDVVFMNSSVVGQRRAGIAAYSASKHALLALADGLRQDVNPRGVRVLSVFLGATATPMQERIHADAGRPYRPDALLQAEDVAEIVLAGISLPRHAELTDLHIRPARPHRSD